ncbi:hypothetical protein ICM05_01165 [Leucobacter sp. cx-42]|uniref:hypothetical protein n=1 Tax=unclassified Leucobacter TaxID=2621730 RepID=UPI00165DBB5D|nr:MULTISPECIES: hypothetical protein [unclassified Leucobacter]MBC9953258.1 hypothetical protein [Leucobacter sp. cx-42]
MDFTIGEVEIELSEAVLVSIGLLVVSLSALLYTVSARPKIVLTVQRRFEPRHGKDVYVGDVLALYNVGRKGTLVTHVGIRAEGISVRNPSGKVGTVVEPAGGFTLPMTLAAGEGALFPFPANFGDEHEKFRLTRGYEVTYYAPRSPCRWKSYPKRSWPYYDKFGWKLFNPLVWSRSKSVRFKLRGADRKASPSGYKKTPPN